MTTDLILGTAGHIDHGKTSLIRALTGTDCDRLPEEKRRGITIDIGFAELRLGDLRLDVVDVPGHERFVRNMLAGATGIDLALLVVAADESVRQQTREHLEILKLLGLHTGVIALTKSDLVDPDWRELVIAEVREFVAGSFLADAPIIPTSAATGAGLDELRAALAAAADSLGASPRHDATAPFRMAIDRTFTIAGHGTVVTGSVSSGCCHVGDTLRIEPGGVEARVRGLHCHGHSVESVRGGQRAAVNLVGVHHTEIARGQELSTPGYLRPSRVMTARIHLLPDARPLKNRSLVRLHVGTAEILATVRLLRSDSVPTAPADSDSAPTDSAGGSKLPAGDSNLPAGGSNLPAGGSELPAGGSELPAGGSALVQLFLHEPAVTTWNQPLVLRSESPVATIGGGRILEPDAARVSHAALERVTEIRRLESDDEVERSSAALRLAGVRAWQPDDLIRSAGVRDPQRAREALRARGELCELAVSASRRVSVHRETLREIGRRVEAALENFYEENPLKLSFPRAHVASGFSYLPEPVLFDAAIEQLRAAGKLLVTPTGLALAGHGPKLSNNERKLLAEMVEKIRAGRVEPPTLKDLQKSAERQAAAVPNLLRLAVNDGQLVEISPELYLHVDLLAEVLARLRDSMGSAGATVSQIREWLGTSRKFAVPLCEYLDREGWTRREGDLRFLRHPIPPTTSEATTDGQPLVAPAQHPLGQ